MDAKEKKAWIRIVEAFIAVIIVLTSILVITQNQANRVNIGQEVETLQTNTLDLVISDDLLRSQILSGDYSGVEARIQNMIPVGYSHSIRICNYTDPCPLGFGVDSDVYSKEVLVTVNLTDIALNGAVKLKLFYWEGTYPDPVCGDYYCQAESGENSTNCPQDCGVTAWECSQDTDCPIGYVCEEHKCVGVVGPSVADIWVSNWQTSGQYAWASGGYNYQRINWNITISNRNNVNWVIKNSTECWARVSSGNLCTFTNAPIILNVNLTNSYSKTSYANTPNTLMPNTYNLTYSGIDANGNVLSVFKEIVFG